MPDSAAEPSPPAPHFTELAVVGAGPAGLAAAVTAADGGLDVVLLDAADAPGGQYYRSPAPGLRATRPEALHHGWARFAGLAARLGRHREAGRIRHLAGHQVWAVERTGADWTLHAVTGPDGDGSATLRAHAAAHRDRLPRAPTTLPRLDPARSRRRGRGAGHAQVGSGAAGAARRRRGQRTASPGRRGLTGARRCPGARTGGGRRIRGVRTRSPRAGRGPRPASGRGYGTLRR